MNIQWVGCESGNFLTGRPPDLKPEIIVLHSAGGPLALMESRFKQTGSMLSCHYGVAKSGEVRQYVLDTDTAFHAGMVVAPSATIVKNRPRANPNFYSIGVEHDDGGGAPPESQIQASAALIESIARRWSIPLDPDHILPHRAIRASAECPSGRFDLSSLLKRAETIRDGAGDGAGFALRLNANANLRLSPSLSAPILGRLLSGTALHVDGFVEGDTVEGNRLWYVHESGHYFWAGATDRPHPDSAGVGDATTSATSTDLMEIGVEEPAAYNVVVDRRLALPSSQYRNVITQKDLIVLHFTAGSTADGAVSGWRTSPERVATAYVVDRDGTTFEIFDAKYWANHLGKMPETQERRSIGIEIVNVGPLRLSAGDPSQLNWWPTAQKPYSARYCGIDDRLNYVKASFRGESYFATFPEPQTTAVASLVRYLCDRFSIPREIPAENKRSVCDPGFSRYKGIANHANFRSDKFDLGPAYNWDTLGI